MTPERWQRIDDIFGAATELPELPDDARHAHVAEACGNDHELRDEILQLLASARDGDAVLRGALVAAAGQLARSTAAPWMGRRIGPYRLVELLGEGGMGVVYRGERDDDAYQGQVAIKILPHGLGLSRATARFRDERQILAALAHPGIVRLLDGGTTDDRLPYLVMEYVDGVPITRYAHDHRLSVRARIALILAVSQALQYAHGQLVVHRDLKPSNLLVDRSGTPKLLDFGIAKLGDPGGERQVTPPTDAPLLTPEYASPEQARGEPVSVASDVYSLGAVLYELLSGQPAQRPTGGPLEILRAICDASPPRPSSVAPAAQRREVAGDLDNIVLKALHKQPSERYASVEQLADDLQRYLDGRPVRARAATVAYTAGRFVRRNRGKLAIAAVVVGALCAATVSALRQADRADQEARRAEASAARAEARLSTLYEEQGRSALLAGRFAEALVYLAEAYERGVATPALRLMLALAARPIDAELATLEAGTGKLWWAEVSRDGALVATAHEDGNARLWRASTGERLATFGGHDGDCLRVRFSPDSSRVVTSSNDSTARLWRIDGTPIATLAGHRDYVWDAVFSPDGTRIATASGDDTAAVWDAATGALLRRLTGHTSDLRGGLAFSPDGTRIVTAAADHTARVWDARTGRELARLAGHTDLVMAVAVGDRLIATASWDRTARLWQLDGTPGPVLTGHSDRLEAIELSRDGALIVTGSHDRTARVWSAQAGALMATVTGHGGIVSSATFSPDSARVLTAALDGTTRVSDARTGTTQVVLDGHRAATWRAAFSPDGARAITASWDGTAKLWDVARDARIAIQAHTGEIRSLALAPGRQHLVSAGDDGVRIWDAGTGHLVRAEAGALAATAASGALASADRSGALRVWDATREGPPVTCTGTPGALHDLAVSPDGALVATAGEHGIRVVRAPDCRLLATAETVVERIAFHPGGSRLVTASGAVATIRDAATLAQVVELRGHQGAIDDLAISPDGRWVATAGKDRTARLWDAQTGAPAAVLRGHAGRVKAVRFSPGSRLLATASEAGDARLWDAESGAELATLPGHGNIVWDAAISPSGLWVATVGDDHRARIWDTATFRLLAVLEGHAAGLSHAVFVSDNRLATAGRDGILNLWKLELEPRSAAELQAVRCRSQLTLDRGSLIPAPSAPGGCPRAVDGGGWSRPTHLWVQRY